MEKVFALHTCQKDLINEVCFDKCGKISIGCINDKELGPMFPCHEENCPYEKDRAPNAIGTIKHNGVESEIWIRAIQKKQREKD